MNQNLSFSMRWAHVQKSIIELKFCLNTLISISKQSVQRKWIENKYKLNISDPEHSQN